MYNIYMRKPNATFEFNWYQGSSIKDDYELTDSLDACDPMVGFPEEFPVCEHFDWNKYYE